jgi:hypothetical protein
MVNNVLEPHVFHFITHDVTTKSLENILISSKVQMYHNSKSINAVVKFYIRYSVNLTVTWVNIII